MHGWSDPFDDDRTYSGPVDPLPYPAPAQPSWREGRHAAQPPERPVPAEPPKYGYDHEPYPARAGYDIEPDRYGAEPDRSGTSHYDADPYGTADLGYGGGLYPSGWTEPDHQPGPRPATYPVAGHDLADTTRRRRPPRAVVLAGTAAAATLVIILGLAGLLLPSGDSPDATASAAGDSTAAAAADTATPGSDGTPSAPASASPSDRPAVRPAETAAPATSAPPDAKPTKGRAPVAPPKRKSNPTPKKSEGTATASPSSTDTTDAAATLAEEVVALVNRERAAAGCDAVDIESRLTTAAQLHSEDQASHQSMSHTGSDGSTLEERIDRVGYVWHIIGENVAYGQATPVQVMNDWMNSEGHRHNILNCEFEDIGVGAANDSAGRLHWTQDFGA